MRLPLLLVSLACSASLMHAQAASRISDRTAHMQRHDGFLPLYHDTTSGKLYLEVAAPGKEMLHVVTLSSGGWYPFQRGPAWDRGVARVHFQRVGGKLQLLQHDPRFVATGSDSIALRRLRSDVYPPTVLWTLPILADENGRLLVDATDFFLRDAFGALGDLRSASESGFRLDRERSVVSPDGVKAFPRNSEVDVLLAFTAEHPSGSSGQGRLADPRAFTLRQRHSFIEAPATGFAPRPLDPRLGMFSQSQYDLGGSYEGGYLRRLILRWRVEGNGKGGLIRPLTVYLEAGIPSAYRNAVREGVLYWRRVFEREGFSDAIRVADLPPDADPLDLRYEIVVLWSPSRDQRTSYASFIADPATGEMIKAYIHLDSYRSLVDYNAYAGMAPALAHDAPDAETYVMTRRRWLVAHELGHVIAGIQHSSISLSQVGFRLPVARATIEGRVTIDLASGDAAEPLDYDRWLVRYAYADLPHGQETTALRAIADAGVRAGLTFGADVIGADPRAVGRLGPDNALVELARAQAVRRLILNAFDENALKQGEPMSLLFDRLVPGYFHHRPALFAVAKMLGGVEYNFALKGDAYSPMRPVPAAEQRRALTALLGALEPGELRIPARIAAQIRPRNYLLSPSPFEWNEITPGFYTYATGESPPIRIAMSPEGIFDQLAWARSIATYIVGELFERERLRRVVLRHLDDPGSPSVHELLRRTRVSTWHAPTSGDPVDAALRRVARQAVLDGLLALARDERAAAEVRAGATVQLLELESRLSRLHPSDPDDRGQVTDALRQIKDYLAPRR